VVEIPPDLAAELKGPLAEPISLLDIDDLSDDERAAIPPWWVEAAEKAGRSAVIHAFGQWDGVLPGLLPRFKRRLADAGIGIHVGRGESKPVLATS
jgi:hypothetical protein